MQGRITIDNAKEMRRRLAGALASKPNYLTVDLAEVAYIDTSALATLVEAARIARGQGTKLILRGVQGQTQHLLQITELDHLFDIRGQEARADEHP